MALRIVNKNSTVQDKAPVAGDLQVGEIAINANVNSPAAYIKDSAGNIVKLAGAGSVGDDWTRTGTALAPKTAGDTLQFSAGTAALPGITPVSDTNTGIYSPGADQVAISTNGTGRLFVDASGNVRVGSTNDLGGLTVNGKTTISVNQGASPSGNLLTLSGSSSTFGGTNNSLARLQIFGTNGANSSSVFLGIGNATTYGGHDVGHLILHNSSMWSSTGGFKFSGNGTTTLQGLNQPNYEFYNSRSDNQDAFVFSQDVSGQAAATLRIYSTRNTSNANAKLIQATSGIGSSFVVQQSGSLEVTTAASTAPFIAKISTSEVARIDSSGRLLVGTSSSINENISGIGYASQVQILGTSTGKGLSVLNNAASSRLCISRLQNVATDTELGLISFGSESGTTIQRAGIACYSQTTGGSGGRGGNLRFYTVSDGGIGLVEAFRINNTQEVLIGYTSDNGAYKLQVNSQIFATNATIATSDGRYKENVATLGGCLALVKALRPVSFTWKPQEDITRLDDEGNEVLVREGHNFPEGTQVGFIAQEVQEALANKPWLGSIIKENVRPAVKDDEGNELAPEEQFFGIAEGNLIAVLTNALQEAVAEIESLKARLTAAGI